MIARRPGRRRRALARWDGDRRPVRDPARGDAARSTGCDTVYKPVPPGLLYLDDDAWDAAAAGRRVLAACTPLPRATGPGRDRCRRAASGAISPPNASRKRSTFSSALADHARRRSAARVRWSSPPIRDGARERLTGAARGPRPAPSRRCPRRAGPALGEARRTSRSGRSNTGSRPPAASDGDLRAGRAGRPADPAPPSKRKRAENFLTEAPAAQPGDLVVHVDHGIGRYHRAGDDRRRCGRAA